MLQRASRAIGALAALLVCFAPVRAGAVIDGTRPSLFQAYRVFGDSVATGNTLMANVPCDPLVNAILLDSSTARISGIPSDASIDGAFLFWSGSVEDAPDRTAQFRLLDGTTRSVSADRCLDATAALGPGLSADYFYCRADVTELVSEHPTSSGSYNGFYEVGDVDARPGFLDRSCNCVTGDCQAMYSGWSLVVIWSSPTERTLRDVVLYDGFELFDETPASAAVDRFTIDRFDIADPPDAKLTFFGMEGDAELGVPPQDSDPVLTCDTCWDYIKVNDEFLSNSVNPPRNIFNSSIPEGSARGVDIDTIDISSFVDSGDTLLRLEVGSGDGNTATGHAGGAGGGELFMLGYFTLTINRLAPNFRTTRTFKTVDPTEAVPGEVLFYTIAVTNDGSQDATNVIVRDELPDDTEYVAGSTRVDGTAVADVGGLSPLERGLNLGTIPFEGDNSRRITFRVRVSPTASDGQRIVNTARIDAAEVAETTVVESEETVIVAPSVLTPQKRFTDANGGDVEPGDIVTYTVTFRKDAGQAAAALSFDDEMSPFVELRSVNASGFTDLSDLDGGAFGTGVVRIEDIEMAASAERSTISYTVQIKSVEALIDAGVDPEEIDGLLVENQGSLAVPGVSDVLLTDDPTTPAAEDPTRFRLASSVNLRNSGTFKSVRDVNGGRAEPGDTIRYTIRLTNTGSRDATVDLSDDLPPFLVDAALTTTVPGVSFSPAPAGASGTGFLQASGLRVGSDGTLLIELEARIADDAPNGAEIQNVARLRVPSLPSQNQDLTTETLVVVAGPDFSGATKVVEGGAGGFEPGDTVTFSVALTNEGNQPGTDTVVTDVIDERLTAIEPLDGGVYTPATRTIRWDVGAVPVGASRTVRFRAQIGVGVPNGAVISNQAFISAAELDDAAPSDDPTTAAADDPTTFRVEALPLLVFEKSVADLNGDAFEPTDEVRYTLVIRNDGRAAATDVTVTDPIPDEIEDAAAGLGGVVAGGAVTWSSATTTELASIGPGGTVTLTWTGRIVSGLLDGTEVSNQATVDAEPDLETTVSDDPSTGEVGDPTVFVVRSEPDLTASTKTVEDLNGGIPQPGDELVYTIRVVNEGTGPANDVIVEDDLADELTEIEALDGGSFDPGARRITWNPPGRLAAGGVFELSFRARLAAAIPDGTSIANQAFVRSAETVDAVPTDDPSTPAEDDPTVVLVESRPDFATSTKEVVHAGGAIEFRPGDEIIYQVTVRNTGTEDATNVVVDDPIDTSALTDVRPGEFGTFDGSAVRWTVPALTAGEEIVLVARAAIVFPLDDGTIVENQAEISSDGVDPVLTDDPSTAEPFDPTVFEVSSRPDLSSSIKTFVDADGEPARPGDTIDYVIVVRNTGTEPARDVSVRDVVDVALTDIDPGDAIFDPDTRTLTWNPSTTPGLAAVGVGEAETVELRFSASIVEPLDNGTIVSNQASIEVGDESYVTDDPSTAAESDPTEFQVISAFDFSDALKFVSAPGPRGYRPGDEVTWTLRLVNDGDAVARNVVVTDSLSDSLVFVDASDGAEFDGTTVTWGPDGRPDLAEVAPGETRDFTIRTTIVFPTANGTEIENQAQIVADGAAAPFVSDDPTTDATDDPTTIIVSAAPDLADVTKEVADEDGDGIVEPGDTLLYTITVANDGDAAATDVVVSDTVAADVLVDVVPLDGGAFDGTAITWSPATTPALASVDPGEASAAVVRFRATVRPGTADGTVVSNQALVSSAEIEDVPTDDPGNSLGDDDPTDVRVVAQPRLDGAEKTVVDVNGGIVEDGDIVEYTIVVPNTGTEDATGVRIVDPLSRNLVDVEALDGGVVDGASITWDVGTIRVGESATVRFRAAIRGGVPDGTAIENQADVLADELTPVATDDPSTPEEDDPTVIVVNARPDFTDSEKTVSDLNGGFVEPGDRVRYTITVRNSGFAAGERVVVADPVGTELFSAIEPGDGGRLDGDAIVWDLEGNEALENVPIGGSVTLSFVATISEDAANGASFDNQATVRDAGGNETVTDDPATDAIDDPTTVEVLFPELDGATKEVFDTNGGDVEPGDTLIYVIRFGAGDGPALTDVTVEDELSPFLTGIELGGSGSFDAATRRVRWEPANTPGLDRIETGELRAVEFRATVGAATPNGSVIRNQALLSSREVPAGVVTDDPSTPEEDDATEVVVAGFVGSLLGDSYKTVEDLDGGLVEPGDTLRYEIVVINSGTTTAEELTVVDPLPPLTSYVADSLLIDGGESVPGDAWPLGEGLVLPNLEPGDSLALSFELRVDDDAPQASLIANQATITALDGADAPTDDPTTPEVDDPTTVIVGRAADLSRTSKAATPVDENGDGIVQPGESIRYLVRIPNRGNDVARAVRFEDVIDDDAVFEPGTLALDGVALTDGAGDDAGSVEGRTIRVEIGDIDPGQAAEIEFVVRVLRGPLIVNQGVVRGDGIEELTDSDGNPGNGDDPTIVVVGSDARHLRATKTVADANGGRIEPGDLLLFTIEVESASGIDEGIVIDDDADRGLLFERVVAGGGDVEITLELERAIIELPQLEPDDPRTVVIAARVDEDVSAGTELCNTISTDVGESVEVEVSPPACVTVGARAGLAEVGGRVFRDIGEQDGVFDPDTDESLAGYTIRVIDPDSGDVVFVGDAGSDGRYELGPLPSGDYLVQVFGPGGPEQGGAFFGEEEITLTESDALSQDLRVDPFGAVYATETGEPVAGVVASIYYADSEADPTRAGRLVPTSELAHPSQQGQVVPQQGYYRFDPAPGHRYRIELDTSTSNLVFPSSRLPAEDEVAVVDEALEVVDADRPSEVDPADRRYFLQFELGEGEDVTVRNNHIPLDPIADLITVHKQADRVDAVVGDIVTYTVTVRNGSNADITFDPETGRGGAYLVDAIPRPFRYVDDSALFELQAPGRSLRRWRPEVEGALLLRFGGQSDGAPLPLELPAGSELQLRYQLVLGSETEPGRTYENVVELRSADGGVVLSNRATAELRVTYDPVFDEGVLLGKVFCDADGDGRQQRGERGLFGARLYLDSGYFVETDSAGQYHFSRIRPGMHLVKLDVATLPTGSSVVTSERRAFEVTRGLPSKIDFPVDCAENIVSSVAVNVSPELLQAAEERRREQFFELSGEVGADEIRVDDGTIGLLRASLTVDRGVPIVAGGGTPAGDEQGDNDEPSATGSSSPFRSADEPVDAEPAADELDDSAEATNDATAEAADDGVAAEDTEQAAASERGAMSAESTDGPTIVTLEEGLLDAELRFTGSTQGPAPSRWVLEVRDMTDDLVVRQWSGDGAPPAAITWDGMDGAGRQLLLPKRVYEASFRVFESNRRFAVAPPTLFGVEGTARRYLLDERFSGDLFVDGSMTEDLRQTLSGLAGQFAETEPAPIEIEVHVDDPEDSTEDMQALTQRRANLVQRFLVRELGVAPGRIEATGRGFEVPLYPNEGERNRRTNRRVVVRIVDQVSPDAELAFPEPPARAPALLADETAVDVGPDGTFEASLVRPPDGLVAITAFVGDGSRSGAIVAVRPLDPEPTIDEQRLVDVPVSVAVEGRRASVGGATASLDALDLAISPSPPVAVIGPRRLRQPFRFAVTNPPPEADGWRLEVFDSLGSVVGDVPGAGSVPPSIRWAGQAVEGRLLVPGRYTARLTVRTPEGGLAVSPPVAIRVVTDEQQEAGDVEPPSPPARGSEEVRFDGDVITFLGGDYEDDVPTTTGRTVLIDVRTAEGARVLLPVAVPEGFEASTVPAQDLSPVRADEADEGAGGDGEPPAATAADVEQQPTEETTGPEPGSDEAAPVDVQTDGPSATEQPSRGAPAGRSRPAPQADPGASPFGPPTDDTSPTPTQEPGVEAEGEPDESGEADEEDEEESEEDEEDRGSQDDGAADDVPSDDGGDDEEEGEEPAPGPFQPISSADGDAPWLFARSGAAPSFQFEPIGEGGQPTDIPAEPPVDAEITAETRERDGVPENASGQVPPRYRDVVDFYREELDAALSTESELDLAAVASQSPAGTLRVNLPPEGAVLQNHRLAVRGETHTDNRIFINGQEVPVVDGRFETIVDLPSGASELLIETLDTEGNRGRLEWPVEVATFRYFLLGMADTAVGTREAEIPGEHDHNTHRFDNGFLVRGESRVYFKGWVDGDALLNGVFDEIEMTGHVDSGKRREYEAFLTETIEPDRSYPVYGDASEQVADVNARGKVYVLIEADDSHVTVGNFGTDIEGVELFRYDRNFYGGQVVIDHEFVESHRTEIRAHAAGQEEQVQRAYNYLRGTGGSIYYLEDREIIEGSEQVTLVVRDQHSGIELARIPMRRNLDYNIRYGEGRIIFKSPLPSVVDDTFFLGGYSSTRSTLRGHPVYAEVAYDHENDIGADGLSAGAHARQTLFDAVSIGGGYVEEQRPGESTYRLWGVEAGAGISQSTRIDVEYARSESNDLSTSYSDDGGLTFGAFRLDDGRDEEGDAVYVRGRAELADVIETERDRILFVEGYYQNQDRGFFANGEILDQGEEKFGAASLIQMTERQSIRARHDASFRETENLITEELDDTVDVERQITTVQYEYALEPIDFAINYQRSFTDDERREDGYESHVVGVGLNFDVSRRLRIGIEEEAIVAGNDPRVIRGVDDSLTTRHEDRFLTTLSAAYRVEEKLEISARESFRFSGENSTVLGLRGALSEDSDVYVQERMTTYRDNHGMASTTVVGAEQRWGEDDSGRSYGEYQLDTGISGPRNRAVLGMGKGWEVAEGLSIDVAYERSQVLASDSVGSQSARDTASVGWEYIRPRQVKYSGRAEMRFENASTTAPREHPCLGDDIVGNPEFCRDVVSTFGDRRQFVTLHSLDWKWTQDWTFLARFHLIRTENLTLDLLETDDWESTLGMAFRPVEYDWVAGLFKYTYLRELRPFGLDPDAQQGETSHVLSVSPMFELPYGFQLVEKVAYRWLRSETEGLPDATNQIVLLINRLNYHLAKQWDAGVEYRFMRQSLAEDWEHGALTEINYIIQDAVRLGVGYNFSRFGNDELSDLNRDASGFFFRVVGQY